jgi:tRNA(fMet)-specific endonuclease VapC
MIYLLDTDVLIFMIRGFRSSRRPGQRRRAELVAEQCRQVQAKGESVAVSAITVSELEYGARLSDDYKAEMTAVRKVLSPFNIHDYDSLSCPPHYGSIRRELEAKGITIGAMDLLIAVHALALDATLVSNNLDHFTRIPGLKTANWL